MDPCIGLITSVSGSRGSGVVICHYNPFAVVGIYVFVMVGIFCVCLIGILAYLGYSWPEWGYRPRVRRLRARAEVRCKHCGYDLRASPLYCPECGRWPEAQRPAMEGKKGSGPAETVRFAWTVWFRAGGEASAVRVPVDQLRVVEAVSRVDPVDGELVFALEHRKQLLVVDGPELELAAGRLLEVCASAGVDAGLRQGLMRLRQFARTHDHCRIEREVGARRVGVGRRI